MALAKKQAISKAKHNAWRRFAEENLQKHLWGAAYKLAARKISNDGVFHSLPVEVDDHLLHVLFPNDQGQNNNGQQRCLRGNIKWRMDDEKHYRPLVPLSELVKILKRLIRKFVNIVLVVFDNVSYNYLLIQPHRHTRN